MLTQRAVVNRSTVNRRDLRRLTGGAVLLVAAMTAILALDLVPQRLDVAVGDVATADIVAPRAETYVSDVDTAAARDEASKAVLPVYDYSTPKAIRIAATAAEQF